MAAPTTVLCAFIATATLGAQVTTSRSAPAGRTPSPKVAALAIDRDNGYHYGWSFDHATRTEAEQAAIAGVNGG